MYRNLVSTLAGIVVGFACAFISQTAYQTPREELLSDTIEDEPDNLAVCCASKPQPDADYQPTSK